MCYHIKCHFLLCPITIWDHWGLKLSEQKLKLVHHSWHVYKLGSNTLFQCVSCFAGWRSVSFLHYVTLKEQLFQWLCMLDGKNVKEIVMACFMVLPHNSSWWTEKNHVDLGHNAQSLVKNPNCGTWVVKWDFWPLLCKSEIPECIDFLNCSVCPYSVLIGYIIITTHFLQYTVCLCGILHSSTF